MKTLKSGRKYDSGKIRASLVLGDFALALEEIAKVGTFGADQYTSSGWLSIPNAEERYEDAKLRHWLLAKQGIKVDNESGLSHAAHEAWNTLAVLELKLRSAREKES